MPAAYEGDRYIEFQRVLVPDRCRGCDLATGIAAVGNAALKRLRATYDERPAHENARSSHCWIRVVTDATLQATDKRYTGLVEMHDTAQREMNGVREHCREGGTEVHTAGEESLFACGYGVESGPVEGMPPLDTPPGAQAPQ
jgi:hypothetical protein